MEENSDRIVEISGIKIKVSKGVFPPESANSESSKRLDELFGDVKNKSVLDIGTGTGIQAIRAALLGAKEVIASDINPNAIICAKENIKNNKLENKIQVLQGDLFEPIEKAKKFDLIIANLPIVDFPLHGNTEQALYDPDYKIHNTFFSEVSQHLKENGVIIMTHANFNGPESFKDFENMLLKYGLEPEKCIDIDKLGYIWRLYRIKVANINKNN